MLKRIGCMLLCALLTLCLWGCEQESAEPTEDTTKFTLPTLNEAQTPDEMLREAVVQAKALEAFSVYYVRIIGQERFALSVQTEIREGLCTAQTLQGSFLEDATMEEPVYRYYENTTCYEKKAEQVQKLSSESPYTLSQIFEALPPFPEGLTDRFSGRSLHVIPAEDGSIRFQLSDLTPSEFEAITGYPCEEGAATVAMIVAGEGYLSGIEFTAPEVQVTLTIRQSTEEEPLTKPAWVP